MTPTLFWEINPKKLQKSYHFTNGTINIQCSINGLFQISESHHSSYFKALIALSSKVLTHYIAGRSVEQLSPNLKLLHRNVVLSL